jgi:hypothetical protein
MQQRTRRHGWVAAAGITALSALVACTDSPVESREPPEPTPGGGNLVLKLVTCTASTRNRTVSCDPAPTGASGDIIVGGQNVYVKVSTTNVNFDAGLGRFTFDANVRNLIPQPLGTTNGTTLDPAGVKLFFATLPTVTNGTGTITVVPDGTATFTAAGQPFYQYNEVLSQYELSPSRQWRLDMTGTVNDFVFGLYVSAPVQFPNGWVEVAPAVHSMAALDTRALSATVRSALGNVDSTGALTVGWNSADVNVATVTPTGFNAATNTYLATLTGVQAGATDVGAVVSSDPVPRTGEMTSNITGIQRLWLGATSNDYNVATNWRHGRVPNAMDTAVVNGDSATQFPQMAQNNTVAGVIMQPGALVPSIDLGAFDYTLTSSIDHGATGTILGNGRMIFTGVAKTIDGGLSNVDYRHARFTGTYSLNTNLNVTGGRIVVQGGRLRNTAHRVRVRPS